MRKVEIVPSILSADFARLAKEIKKIEQAGCQRIHLDVMDGKFVPNITFGPVVISAIRGCTDLHLEVQLMIDRPERYIEDFKRSGVNSIFVHQEACCDYLGTIRKIKELGMEAGIAINPGTPVESIKGALREIDMLLIMTVEPGFGGQPFIKDMEKKISQARMLLEKDGLDIPIEVDGGVDAETIPLVVKTGATRLVADHTVFDGDVIENVKKLRSAICS